MPSSSPPAATSAAADLPPPAPRRILLVDDVAVEARQAADALRASYGDRLELLEARTLAEATRALMETDVDAVVSELDLPDARGLALVAAARSAAPLVPLVVYTRVPETHLGAACIRAGAQDWRTKADTPPSALATLVELAMVRHRQVAQLEEAKRAAAHRATHDPLTGLANRELFVEHLERAIAFGERYGRKTGLLFVDLDGFKQVNDTLGHAAGDRMLKEVAQRLLGCVRRSDAVGRLAGDEFVIVLPDVTSRLDLAHVRDLVLRCFNEPIALNDGEPHAVGASVGGAMSPLDGATAQELLDAADAAMYREKYQRRRGRMPTPVFGSASVDGSIARRRESRLAAALDCGELAVHFQPQVDVRRGRVVGCEALLRWTDPEFGEMAPLSFLPLAEDTGLILPIGDHVLREACRAAVRWRTEPERDGTMVSVNLSAVQLRERGFEARVERVLAETGCPPGALVLELNDANGLVEGEQTLETLRALRALGVRLVVDDFGVGYGSLEFLRQAPLDGFKLDRRFVSRMTHDARDAAVVEALATLARGLGLAVIGEGVETTEQRDRLVAMGCVVQQGYLYGAPAAFGESCTQAAVASLPPSMRRSGSDSGEHAFRAPAG